jgi:hypothetical protein
MSLAVLGEEDIDDNIKPSIEKSQKQTTCLTQIQIYCSKSSVSYSTRRYSDSSLLSESF